MGIANWFKGLFEPSTEVDGVELPAIDDPRWKGVVTNLRHESVLFRKEWEEEHLIIGILEAQVFVVDDDGDPIIYAHGHELDGGERYGKAVIRRWLNQEIKRGADGNC